MDTIIIDKFKHNEPSRATRRRQRDAPRRRRLSSQAQDPWALWGKPLYPSLKIWLQDLTTLLAYKQPDNIDQFIIDQIKIRKENGTRSIVYTDQELQNIFTLYDLKGAGHITKEQTREALKTLANSEFHFTKAQEAVIPTKVDLFTFMKVCDDVLGIKWARSRFRQKIGQSKKVTLN